MGNVFKSMTLAVALAAGGTNVKAEGGLDTRVMKTKEALAELLGSLDPVTYGKAMEVLQGDLGLLTDGRLDPTDEPTIIDHMGKLAKLFPEETDKVLKAMNEVDTVVALNEVAPLNESPEERKERLEREQKQKKAQKSAETLTNEFLDDKNWKFAPDNTLDAKIKRNGRSIEIEGDIDTDVKREAKIDFATTLAAGNYNITVIMSAGGPLRLYLYDSTGKSIDMSGGVMPEGGGKAVAQLLSSMPTKISIPSNCRKCLFQGKITAQDQDNKIIIDGFLAQGVIEGEEFAKN